MASSRGCSIDTCKRSSRVLCNCCQKYFCVDHLKQHSDLLNAELTPLADEINALYDQFNYGTLLQSTFLIELDKWRAEAHRIVDDFYERKQQEFVEFIVKLRETQKTKLEQLRNQVHELIREQDATEKHVDSINNSIQFFKQQMNEFQLDHFTLTPLILDDQLITIHQRTLRLNELLTLPSPCRIIKLNITSFSIAANEKCLLVQNDSKLCLSDRQLIVTREIRWPHGVLNDMFWSTTLAQYILITSKEIFTFDEQTMTIKQLSLGCKSDISRWWCGTCTNDKLFLATSGRGPSIYEYTLQPSIQFLAEYTSPIVCSKDEVINDLSSNNIALALLISNRQSKGGHLDLCSPITLERHWSIQLETVLGRCRIRCCSLINEQWMVTNPNNSEILHISTDGKLVNKEKYNVVPWHGAQLGDEVLAVLTKDGVNVHQLP